MVYYDSVVRRMSWDERVELTDWHTEPEPYEISPLCRRDRHGNRVMRPSYARLLRLCRRTFDQDWIDEFREHLARPCWTPRLPSSSSSSSSSSSVVWGEDD